jgi:hypothetical protein
VSAIEGLLEDVDRLWTPIVAGRVSLHVIGASALLLQTDYGRATKDGDVLETAALDGPTRTQLLALAGRDSKLAGKHRLYVEIVASALPFLPQRPLWHPHELINGRLQHLDLYMLDVVDVVVSKIFRFNANDRNDIGAMVGRDLVDHGRLLERFRLALRCADGAQAHRLPDCVENLHTVERDFFATVETTIELPQWVDED